MDPRPYFHLSFRPNIKLVSTVRRFTDEFYRRVLSEYEVSARLALATHELLENAVAYACDGETAIRIERHGDNIVIKTWNQAATDRLTTVRAMIDEIAQATDPDEFYQAQLVKTARRTDGSGLGLARIRAEALMTLAYEIDRDRICVMATASLTSVVA